MIIYRAQNKINGKIYIGQTSNLSKRISCHLCGKTYFSDALRKYGVKSFDFSIVDSADTKELLGEKEKYWIKSLNSMYPNGYNLTSGGEEAYTYSEETRRKMSERKIGFHHSEETKKKFREFRHSEDVKQKLRGRFVSEDTKRKMSESKMGEKNPAFGKHFDWRNIV